jgi:uncharacterized protein with ATP-grasp and redox domains
MKSWEREEKTHTAIVKRFLRRAGMEEGEALLLERELERYMQVKLGRRQWIRPEITRFHTEWYRELYRITGGEDPYLDVKAASNEAAREILASLEIAGFEEAVRAAIVANRMDYGAFDYEGSEGLPGARDFEGFERMPLAVDDMEPLTRAVQRANLVLYLLDNHGEVLFDEIVMAEMRRLNGQARIVAAAKASPMLNDVTRDEAVSLGLSRVCELISTGSNCFGVPEDEVSAEFLAAARAADVIVAKGQAHLEFWLNYGVPNVFNVAHTKFPVRDPAFGELPAGSNLVLCSGRYRGDKPGYGL